MFYFDKNQIVVKSDEAELISRVIDGEFPPYQEIIPNEFETKIHIDRDEFSDAIKLAGSVGGVGSDIKIYIPDGKKVVEVSSSEKALGKTKSTLSASIEGEAGAVIFNRHYLLDGVKNIKDKTITLGLNGLKKAAMVTSSDASYSYILMPVNTT